MASVHHLEQFQWKIRKMHWNPKLVIIIKCLIVEVHPLRLYAFTSPCCCFDLGVLVVLPQDSVLTSYPWCGGAVCWRRLWKDQSRGTSAQDGQISSRPKTGVTKKLHNVAFWKGTWVFLGESRLVSETLSFGQCDVVGTCWYLQQPSQ